MLNCVDNRCIDLFGDSAQVIRIESNQAKTSIVKKQVASVITVKRGGKKVGRLLPTSRNFNVRFMYVVIP